MSAKPTPTPWIADIDETAVIRDSQGNQIAIFTFINTKTGGRRSADEVIASLHAAVLVVNSHEAMVEALERIAGIEDKLYGGDWDEIEEAREIAKAALALAKGE